jgi:hypothetical protein
MCENRSRKPEQNVFTLGFALNKTIKTNTVFSSFRALSLHPSSGAKKGRDE